MKRFNLLVYVYRGINNLDEKFIRKNHLEYKSDLSKHVLIVTALSIVTILLSSVLRIHLMSHMLSNNVVLDRPIGGSAIFSLISMLPMLCCIIYWLFYLHRHLHLLPSTGQKIGYSLFTCVILAVLGPGIFLILTALILLTIAVSIALFLLRIILAIIAMFDGNGSGSKKKKHVLDDGTVVEKNTGMFGDGSYYGTRGEGKYDRSGSTFTKE